jgi:translation elongation factor EF-1alpha
LVPLLLLLGDSCEIVMAPKMPICISAYDQCKPLARIAAMDSNSLVMLGKVTAVVAKEEK